MLLDELAQRPVDDSCRAQSTATSGQLLRPADGASEREREQRAERGWMDRREDETRREEERRRRPRARRVGCPARPGRAARPRQRAARASRRSRRARPTPTEGPRDGNGPCNASNRQSSARAPHSSAAEGPSSNLAPSRSTSLHLAASRYISLHLAASRCISLHLAASRSSAARCPRSSSGAPFCKWRTKKSARVRLAESTYTKASEKARRRPPEVAETPRRHRLQSARLVDGGRQRGGRRCRDGPHRRVSSASSATAESAASARWPCGAHRRLGPLQQRADAREPRRGRRAFKQQSQSSAQVEPKVDKLRRLAGGIRRRWRG